MRSLRRARGLTQDELARRSDLAVDTIRRVEHGAFSPSLDTLRKLGDGLGLSLSTLFASLEVERPDLELRDVLRRMDARTAALAMRIVRVLADG